MKERPAHLSSLDSPAEDLQRCHDVHGLSSLQNLTGLSIFVTGGNSFTVNSYWRAFLIWMMCPK